MTLARIVDAKALPPYDLGADHPFARDRLVPLFDLLDAAGLVRPDEFLRPAPLSAEELSAVHDRDYVALLQRLSDPVDRAARALAPRFGLGTGDNPIHPGQHDGAAAIAGATVGCVHAVLDGSCEAAFDPAGGLHHAFPHAASGFCLYNDLALGIVAARRRGVERVAYVDFDVHHGDGVEWIFREDPSVLTISFHEDPNVRFPGTGHVEDRGVGAGLGSAINVPLAPGTTDASWQRTVAAVVEAALERFAPDLLVTQHGADPHFSDPLADLQLTTASFEFAARLARDQAARHCAGRWVATGGGGYRPFSVLPRAFAIVWCVLSGRPLPDVLPEAWRRRWQPRTPEPLPTRLHDAPHDDPRAAMAAAVNERTLARLRRLHGL